MAKDLTLLDARILFDALQNARPSFVNYLAPDADIVYSAAFEQAVIKVLVRLTALLTRAEETSLELFLCALATVPEPASVSSEGFTERTLKRRKDSLETSSYILLEAIPPTSNIVKSCSVWLERYCAASAIVLRR
ncbi:hypothetical protein PR003_g1675 [Phytophthora rubi]|uniref:Uncharacterized protein n=1 Tax=Phytophthora rubi TaxID=129364 RepID=A0A6A4G563_9STRA|nr:hypothetical protein PR003_g1675 [Phytophthora rubi]